MKKLIRNATSLAVGLFLVTLVASATTWNRDIHAGYVYGVWVPSASLNDSVSAPAGATVSWYAYTYGGSGSSATASVSGAGVSGSSTAYDDQSVGGNQSTTSSGTVIISLTTTASVAGGTGCGVTVAW